MPYREDLEAALAHAEAAERQLEAARAENQSEHKRIAELEKQLAAATRGVHETKERDPASKRQDAIKAAREARQAAEAKVDRSSSAGNKAKPKWHIGLAVAIFGSMPVVFGLVLGPCGPNAGAKDRVNISGDLAGARAKAEGSMPDPELVAIKADYVSPLGVTDLTAYGGRVSYTFVSPSRLAVPEPVPTGPLGAPAPTVKYETCATEVRYSSGRLRVYETSGRGVATCGEALPTSPSCTVVDVWNEAIRRGAPSNALASIRLDMRDVKLQGETKSRHIAAWRFSISGSSGTVAEYTMPDRCPFGR